MVTVTVWKPYGYPYGFRSYRMKYGKPTIRCTKPYDKVYTYTDQGVQLYGYLMVTEVSLFDTSYNYTVIRWYTAFSFSVSYYKQASRSITIRPLVGILYAHHISCAQHIGWYTPCGWLYKWPHTITVHTLSCAPQKGWFTKGGRLHNPRNAEVKTFFFYVTKIYFGQ